MGGADVAAHAPRAERVSGPDEDSRRRPWRPRVAQPDMARLGLDDPEGRN